MRFMLKLVLPLLLPSVLYAYGPGKLDHQTMGELDSISLDSYPIIDLRKPAYLESIVSDLSKSRAVLIGETHADYAHHQLQLSVIKKLHENGANLAIGMEMFQRPVQPILDDYIAGEVNEQEMLLETDWYGRWKYDYRLYRPILTYAQKNGIPIVALNAAQELVDRVSEVGYAGLSKQEQASIPDAIDFTNKAYQDYLEGIYELHRYEQKGSFNRFVEVQLLWDETMAETAASYLIKNPDKSMVILAGSGHVQHGYGIPDRLERRLNVDALTILPMSKFQFDSGLADFVISPGQSELPPVGLIGIYMEDAAKGEKGVIISEAISGGAAKKAGIKDGDVMLKIDSKSITRASDVRVALLDKKPGDSVKLQLMRQPLFGSLKVLDVEVTLGGEL